MQVEMITYTNPLTLDFHPIFKEYTSLLHICATDSLRAGVQHFYKNPEVKEVITGPVVTSGLMIERLLGKQWSSAETKMLQYTKLTGIIRRFEQEDENQKKRMRAFRLNQADVLKTMRDLAELGLTPDDIAAETEEEKIFTALWREMEESDQRFKRIRQRLGVELADRNNFMKEFRKALQTIPEAGDLKRDDAVILHGFYFITPIQHKFFSMMKDAGIKLIFLNLYDERFPKTFETVKAFISQENGWTSDWHPNPSQEKETTWGTAFASAYQDELDDIINTLKENHVVIHAQQDFHTLLREYEEYPNGIGTGREYFSPRYKEINERIREYYPENYKDRHFLAYPVGQFLFHLHKMWDEQEQELIINTRSLYECFASGWLHKNGLNGRQYTYILSNLLPYFESCRTLSEWRSQALLLDIARKEVVNQFERTDKDTPKLRFHKMMENPFSRFSFFQPSTEEIEAVLMLIEHLFRTAEELFSVEDEQVSLSEHFEKIEQILLNDMPQDALLQEERNLLKQISERLRRGDSTEESFFIQDLSDAIALYLGGAFEDDNEAEEEKSSGTEQNKEKQERKVRRFEDIDGAALMGYEHVHVCGLDEESLPYKGFALPWPLSRKCIEKLHSCTALQMVLLREKMQPQISRYLFYTLLTFSKNITLSWIEEWQDKKFKESLYLMMLEIDFKSKKEDFSLQNVSQPDVIGLPVEEAIATLTSYPPDAAAEYMQCGRRFYYSFLAQEFAYYRDDFHYQFLFSNLLKTAAVMSGRSDEEVYEQVSLLFPQWTEVKKKSLAEEAFKYKKTAEGYENVEGREYSNARKMFQFLLSSYSYKNKNLLEEPYLTFVEPEKKQKFLEYIEEEIEHQMEANPSQLCRFCPHLSVCRDGWYAVDDELRE